MIGNQDNLDKQESSHDFRASLAQELRDTVQDAIAMLSGREALDPVFLLDCCATAGLCAGSESDFKLAPLLEALHHAAFSAAGRAKLREAAALVELGPKLDLTLDMDEFERVDRFHRLVELSGLERFLEGPDRARLGDLIERNQHIVLGDLEHFADLHGPALFLRDALPVPRRHLARRFVDAFLTATEPFPVLLDEQRLATLLEAAHARVLANVPWWRSLWEQLGDAFAEIGHFIDRNLERPALVAASSRGAQRATWPAPRLVLWRGKFGTSPASEAAEISLLANQRGLIIEWFGGGSAPERALAHPGAVPLEALSSARGVSSIWKMDLAGLQSGEPYIEFGLGDETHRVGLTSNLGGSHEGLHEERRFERLLRDAPGAARVRLEAIARSDVSAARRKEAELSLQALPSLTLSREIGVAYFPVTPVGASDFHGALATVQVHSLARSRHDLARVLGFVQAFGGASQAVPGNSLKVSFGDLDGMVLGDSWQLAAAGAIVSRLLGEPPRQPIVASGAVRADGTLEAIDELEAKRAILAQEAPGVDAVIVDQAGSATAAFEMWFGKDVAARLCRVLGHNPSALARQAVDHLRRDERPAAQRLAEEALRLGVEGLARADALWVSGATKLHEARVDEALSLLAEARAEYDKLGTSRGKASRFAAEEIEAFLGIALLDAGRPVEGATLLGAALGRLDLVDTDHRDHRWDVVRLQVAGSLARTALSLGRLDEARTLLETSLEVSYVPEERARTLGDLAEIERRDGNLEAARSVLAQAREALAEIAWAEARNRTSRFLRLFEVRAEVESANYPVERPSLSDWPQLAETLEALLSTSPEAMSAWFDEEDLLTRESLPVVVHFVYLSVLARAVVKWGEVETLVTHFARIRDALAQRCGEGPLVPTLPPDWAQVVMRSPY
jgi:tetratricopeptide (TPR) repeat protein